MADKRTGSGLKIGIAKIIGKSAKWLALFFELLGRPILLLAIGGFIVLTYLIRFAFFLGILLKRGFLSPIFRILYTILTFFFGTLGFLFWGIFKIIGALARSLNLKIKKGRSWLKEKFSLNLVKIISSWIKKINRESRKLKEKIKTFQLKKRGKRTLKTFIEWKKKAEKVLGNAIERQRKKIRQGWLGFSSFLISVKKEVKRIGNKKIILKINWSRLGPILGIFLFFFFLIAGISIWGYFEIIKDLPSPERLGLVRVDWALRFTD